MKSKKLFGNLVLLLTALIWGCAFVAQSSGMDYVGPFTFQTSRSILGCLVLIPFIFANDAVKKKNNTYEKQNPKTLILGGILCGTALTVASGLQQYGMQYSTAGKGAFITAMYIVLVPILGLFMKKKVNPIIWISVILGALGLYLLCIKEDFSLGEGDIYLILCAVAFSFHILIVDHFSAKVDGVKLSCLQFGVMFILSAIFMFMTETSNIADIKAAWLPICYAGIMSCGVGYTLQIVGQKYTEPTVASLLMSLESVFAVIAGIILLKEAPSAKEWLGCASMFAAIIIAQIPQKPKEAKKTNVM